MIKAKHFAMLPPETEIDVDGDSQSWIKFSKPGAEFYLYVYAGSLDLSNGTETAMFKTADECFRILARELVMT
jgi:hypothetical protein